MVFGILRNLISSPCERKTYATKGKKMSKVKVVFEVEVNDNEALNFKYFLQDLLETSTLPALSANLIPLTLNVTQKRG